MTQGIRRNLFEVENARALSPLEVASTFVATQSFWRLLSPKNHVVIGARGSGKTALAKMLSHDHLSLLEDERAKAIIAAKSLIGIYIPTRLEWVSALRNKPWSTPEQAEEFFSWRLNIASCLCFLKTVRSCLNAYFDSERERALAELSIVEQLVGAWLSPAQPNTCITSIPALAKELRRVEYIRQRNYAMARALGQEILEMPDGRLGLELGTELFGPLQFGTHVLAELLDLPEESRFMVVIDEAEFLNADEQKILNSFFRAHGDQSVFKMTTMPYRHLTLATNTEEDIKEGHDFEYIYVDQDPVVDVGDDEDLHSRSRSEFFAKMVFNKRAERSGSRFSGLTLDVLLGGSTLLDSTPGDWSESGQLQSLLLKHCDAETKVRAKAAWREVRAESDSDKRDRLLESFSNTIGRKLRGALLLREAVATQRGAMKLELYSGLSMIVRCADGNPRLLIRIFNALLRRGDWRKKRRGRPLIAAKLQNSILTSVSDGALTRIQAAPELGMQLYRFIDLIGESFEKALHEDELATDTYSSIDVSEADFVRYGRLIRAAVSYGLLYVSKDGDNEAPPLAEGRFRLAYILAPHFKLLPRKGRARTLSRILPTQGSLVIEGIQI